MAEGNGRAGGDTLPVESGRSLFRAGVQRDPSDVGSACRFLLLETPDRILEPPHGGRRPRQPLRRPRRPRAAVREPAGVRLPRRRPRQLPALPARHLGRRAPPVAAARAPVSRAVIAASLVLAASLAASVGFLAVRGGFDAPHGERPARAGGRPGQRRAHRDSRRGDPAHQSSGAEPPPVPDTHLQPGADPRADTEPGVIADADPGRDERPLRRAHEVREPGRLLGVRHPVRRQPAKHRELVRRLVRPDAVR